jgi:hypothetical protein
MALARLTAGNHYSNKPNRPLMQLTVITSQANAEDIFEAVYKIMHELFG